MRFKDLNSPENRARRQLTMLGGYDFHRMRTYVHDMRSMLKNESAKIINDYNHELKTYPNSDQFISQLRDDVYLRRLDNSENNFVGYLLNSALVASASVFEEMFKRVCRFAAYKTSNPFNEPKQQVLIRCKEYTSRLKIGIDEIAEHWQTIEMFLQVRHLITHHGSTFPYEKKVFDPKVKVVIDHIKGDKRIMIRNPRSKKPKQFFIVDHVYIIDFIDVAHDYLVWILMQLPERRLRRSIAK